jgi:hypothetical protein
MAVVSYWLILLLNSMTTISKRGLKMIEYNGKEYDQRHGGPFDRGTADSWYSRGVRPHYFVAGTHESPLVDRKDMTEEQIADYMAGYEYNEEFGHKKEY